MKRNRRWIYGVGGLIAVALVAYFALNGRSTQAQTETPAPETVTAFLGDLSASATASGYVVARQAAALAVTMPGEVTAVAVRVGQPVAAGELLVQLDDSNLVLNVATAAQTVRLRQAALLDLQEPAAAADVTAAEAALRSARANLDDLLAGPSQLDLAVTEANLRSAQASLAAAAAELSRSQSSVSDAQIQSAQAALWSAQLQQAAIQEENEASPNESNHAALLAANQAVAAAQAQLDSLLTGPDTTPARSSVSSAAARLDGSQANLNVQMAGASAVQLAGAEAQLAQAEATLAALLDGATTEQIAIAEAELVQAQLTLADADAALADATVVAPFVGVITAVYVSPGEIANGVVVEMVNTATLQVILAVDEIDVANLQVGQAARITLETWPDVEIASEVLTIAPQATTSAGSALVNYDVYLSLGETALPVRTGMTANANLITSEKKDVLLVPNQAINADREKGTYSVNLMTGDSFAEVTVTIGARDSQNTEISSGLNAGDEMMVGNSLPTQSFGPGSDDNGGGPPFGGN